MCDINSYSRYSRYSDAACILLFPKCRIEVNQGTELFIFGVFEMTPSICRCPVVFLLLPFLLFFIHFWGMNWQVRAKEWIFAHWSFGWWVGGVSTSFLLLHWTNLCCFLPHSTLQHKPKLNRPPNKKIDDVFSGIHRTWLRTAGVSEHGASSQIRIAGGRLEIWLLRQAAGCCPLLPAKQSLRY